MSQYMLGCFITINAAYRTQVDECSWAGWMSEGSVKGIGLDIVQTLRHWSGVGVGLQSPQ